MGLRGGVDERQMIWMCGQAFAKQFGSRGRVPVFEPNAGEGVRGEHAPFGVAEGLLIEGNSPLPLVSPRGGLKKLGEHQRPKCGLCRLVGPEPGAAQGCQARTHVAALRVPPGDDVSAREEVGARSARQPLQQELRIFGSPEREQQLRGAHDQRLVDSELGLGSGTRVPVCVSDGASSKREHTLDVVCPCLVHDRRIVVRKHLVRECDRIVSAI